MSVHDLLLALLLPSADDAAEDLAYNVGDGSVARFVGDDERRARRSSGSTHTHYSTPIGLDTPGNYSTAADLVKLADYDLIALSRSSRASVALPRAVLRTGNYVRYVVNRNDLVGRVPVDQRRQDRPHRRRRLRAGRLRARRGGMTLLSAVLGTASEAARDANTLALLDYGFANFRLAHPGRAPAQRPGPADRQGPAAARAPSLIAARGVHARGSASGTSACGSTCVPAPADRPAAARTRRRHGRGAGRRPPDRRASRCVLAHGAARR